MMRIKAICDQVLTLSQIQNGAKPSYANKKQFLAKIDQLPQGPKWECDIEELQGDLLDEKGNPLTENLEFWRRNPVELVQELIGNPAFKDSLRYAPERVLEKVKGRVQRVYSEMWTADWWWDVQVRQLFRTPTSFAE